MTERDYRRYEKLAEKLANKYSKSSSLSYDDIYSMALEGMVVAFNKYDGSSRESGYISTMMVKYILIGIQDESRTVRIPYSRYKKDKDEDCNSSSSCSLVGYDASYDDDYDISHIIEYIESLDPKVKDMVLSFYGISDKKTGRELAKQYNISPAMVTYTINKALKDIRNKIKQLEL